MEHQSISREIKGPLIGMLPTYSNDYSEHKIEELVIFFFGDYDI